MQEELFHLLSAASLDQFRSNVTHLKLACHVRELSVPVDNARKALGLAFRHE